MSHQAEPPSPDFLSGAIRDPVPFPLVGSTAYDWLCSLPDHFPLWSFQPFAYYHLHDTELPTTFPLQVMIDSILEDDQIPTDPPEPLHPPLSIVDGRRACLAGPRGSYPHWGTRREWEHDNDEPTQLVTTAGPQLVDAPELFNRGLEGEAYYDPPHHKATEVGRELARRYEDRESARAADEQTFHDAAKSKLRTFLKRIGIKLGRGGPRKGPPDALLEALVQEALDLFEICWDCCPIDLPEEVREQLRDHDVDPDDCGAWAVNLVLPILSGHEVRVLIQQIHAARDWSRSSLRPTPARLAVYCVAHRLGMAPSSIAEKTRGSGAADELRDTSNPFESPPA